MTQTRRSTQPATCITMAIVTLVGAGMLIAAVPEQKRSSPETAEMLMGAALHQEEVDGNLHAAIATYKKVIADPRVTRSLAATALLHLGQSYEKLGDTAARTAYERVVREFADQADSATTARRRLAALQSSTTPVGPVARRLWDNVNQWSYDVHASSADGRYVSFTGALGDLYVRDLKEGANHRLTTLGEKTGGREEAEDSLVSPDGRYVAYGWTPGGDGFDLRILPLSGQPAEPWILHQSDETDYTAPVGWTPDGKNLLVLRTLQDKTGQIAFISIIDGSLRVLKSPNGWDEMGDVSLSPDGRFIAYDAPAGAGVAAHDIFVLAADGSRETVVVQSPAEDRQPVWSPDGSQILFVSNRTGNTSLWAVRVDGGNPRGSPQQISGNIGRLLGMTRSGALHYVTGGPTSNIYTVDVDANMKVKGTPVRATDRFINGNRDPRWSRDGQLLAYRRSSEVVIRSVKTGEERVIPTALQAAQLTGWLPDGRSLVVESRAREQSRMEFHRLDTTSGSAELLLSVNGTWNRSRRPDLSPDGKSIFYIDRSREPGKSILMRFDIDSRRNMELMRASASEQEEFRAVAVSPDGRQLAFVEAEWLSVVPVDGGEPRRVFRRRFDDGGSSRWELAWTPDQRYLMFVSDKDDAGIERGGEKLWRVPVGGGEREMIGVSGKYIFLALDPGGHRLTYEIREDRPFELWALENFLPKDSPTR